MTADSRADFLELDNLDRFKPKRDDETTEPDQKQLRQVAETTGFQSRDPQAERKQRRARRTGRTQQFTTKTTPGYHTLIYEIADGKIDGKTRLVGEVLEQAIDALMDQIKPSQKEG